MYRIVCNVALITQLDNVTYVIMDTHYIKINVFLVQVIFLNVINVATVELN